VSQQGRPLGVNIFYALVPLLGAGIKAVLLAGKGTPVGVCISCIIPGVAKQFLGLAVIGAARQKQCQTDNGKASFPASQKSYQKQVSHGCAIITPSATQATAHRMAHSYFAQCYSSTRP